MGLFQQDLCVGDSQGENILSGGDTGVFFEAVDEPGGADVQFLGVFLNADILVEMGMEIMNGFFDFLSDDDSEFFGLFSLDGLGG